MTEQKNQGEGNREAARNYNEATREFTREHDTESLAREAGDATANEKEAMKQAEAEGRSKAKPC